MVQSHLTWTEIFEFVSSIHTTEGAIPNRSFYRQQANQCLRELAEKYKLYEKSWVNTGGGPISISSNTVTLPADLASIDSVEYAGSDIPLERWTVDSLNETYPGWRTDTGDPTKYCMPDSMTLVLNTIPTSPTGKLTIRGTAYLPAFSDTPADPNPLAYLPVGTQLIVAYYILANLPLVPAVPVNQTPLEIQAAQAETARRQQARADYQQKYLELEAKFGSLDNRRKRSPFVF